MDSIAAQLVSNDHCGQDLQKQNPLVVSALTGLQNYLLYYGAGCLKDNATDIYCTFPMISLLTSGYTLAITNSTNSADTAVYYLPTLSLISGAQPSCSYCNQQLFDIYDTFSSNSTLGISKNYLQAAEVVDSNCGAGFVSTTKAKTSGTWRVHVNSLLTMTLVGGWVGMALWMFS